MLNTLASKEMFFSNHVVTIWSSQNPLIVQSKKIKHKDTLRGQVPNNNTQPQTRTAITVTNILHTQ